MKGAHEMPDDRAIPLDVSESFKNLKAAARDLRAASKELGDPIAVVGEALDSLDLRLTAWVPVKEGGDSARGEYWSEEVGYTNVGHRWGIALRTVSGNSAYPDEEKIEQW